MPTFFKYDQERTLIKRMKLLLKGLEFEIHLRGIGEPAKQFRSEAEEWSGSGSAKSPDEK